MSELHIADHPLVKNKLALLRNSNTGNKEFREIASEIAMLICYEATKDYPTERITVDSPMGEVECEILSKKIAVTAILRAGLGMVDGILDLIPNANVGHIGLYRDPDTLLPIEYFCKLPVDAAECEMLLVDPMLATGGTASAAITFLKERGVKHVKLLCLIAAPEGVRKLSEEHPDVDIYTASLDTGLNEHGYILPGLGDAGDRLFGTK
ncbi:MAG: uracil phosphoribosyltransferase [Firmicutes bacterium]|nr:uracil phosphoribosyltransferase [Bacillota bacterium]